MRIALMLVGAAAVAVVVWLSVAADALSLAGGAGWWALAVVAFPAFMGFAVWRGWGD